MPANDEFETPTSAQQTAPSVEQAPPVVEHPMEPEPDDDRPIDDQAAVDDEELDDQDFDDAPAKRLPLDEVID